MAGRDKVDAADLQLFPLSSFQGIGDALRRVVIPERSLTTELGKKR
jgi:hypothetical protein